MRDKKSMRDINRGLIDVIFLRGNYCRLNEKYITI